MKVNMTNYNWVQPVTAIVAVVFGLLTVFAGIRVLFGLSEPGYTLFLPLLSFNTVMGFVYIGAGFLIRKNTRMGLAVSKYIFLINLAVLVIILLIYLFTDSTAIESVMAMGVRTVVWLIIFGLLSLRGISSNNT
jgi:hypothetical protein